MPRDTTLDVIAQALGREVECVGSFKVNLRDEGTKRLLERIGDR